VNPTVPDLQALALQVLAGTFVLALAFGAIAQRTHFCTMGAVADIVGFGDWTRMRMWVLAIGVAIIGFNTMVWLGWVDPAQSIYGGTRFAWLSALAGGLLFGCGMVFASGCASKTLVRLGGGNLKALVVAVVMGVSAIATLKGLTGVLRVASVDAFFIELPAQQSLPAFAAHWFGGSKAMLALLLGWALLRHQLLDLRPVGRSIAFDSLGQGVLIVDAEQRIVDLNAAAGRLLRRSPATVLGRPLAALLPGLELGALPAGGRELALAAGGFAELRLQVGVAPIGAERGAPQGMVLTLHDVTREREAQQTLLGMQRQLEEANRELERVAHTDMLTGLANRRLLLARLEMELARARRNDAPLALLLIDLDRFKQVNDTRGHLVGDAVLRATGAALRELTRPEDTPARYGGEELALLLTDTGPEAARTAALRVWERLRAIEHVGPDGERFRVSCCIGIALRADADAHANDLIARADAALYAAKAAGRDRVMLAAGGAIEPCPAGGQPHLRAVAGTSWTQERELAAVRDADRAVLAPHVVDLAVQV